MSAFVVMGLGQVEPELLRIYLHKEPTENIVDLKEPRTEEQDQKQIRKSLTQSPVSLSSFWPGVYTALATGTQEVHREASVTVLLSPGWSLGHIEGQVPSRGQGKLVGFQLKSPLSLSSQHL